MSEKEIHRLCRKYNITNYTINKDKSIDVNQNVNLEYNKLKKIPLTFNEVKGNFSCGHNNIHSLKYSPNYISGFFICNGNNLKTFNHFPNVNKFILLNYNPVNELWYLFNNKNYIDYFNELDIIQDDENTVILDRLNYFLTDIGKPEITKDSIKNYKVI